METIYYDYFYETNESHWQKKLYEFMGLPNSPPYDIYKSALEFSIKNSYFAAF